MTRSDPERITSSICIARLCGRYVNEKDVEAVTKENLK
jgi:hypothetical protein